MAHKHSYKVCLTPPDSGRKWYRCECGVFAFKKKRNLFETYKCSTTGCSGDAIDRLHGRGPRACYLWTCVKHDQRGNDDEPADDQPPQPATDTVAEG